MCSVIDLRKYALSLTNYTIYKTIISAPWPIPSQIGAVVSIYQTAPLSRAIAYIADFTSHAYKK
jgi:hypothetical protein